MTSIPAPRTRRLMACLAGLLLLGAGLAACSSTPSGPARPQRVTWHDYRSQAWFELVNESHTGRVEQYSEVRKDASRKVQTDEIVSALVSYMRKNGFAAQARPGPAPRGSDGQTTMSIEIEDDGTVEHIIAWRGMPADQKVTVFSLAQDFATLYNDTYGLQSVEVDPGETPFANPAGPTRQKPTTVLKSKG